MMRMGNGSIIKIILYKILYIELLFLLCGCCVDTFWLGSPYIEYVEKNCVPYGKIEISYKDKIIYEDINSSLVVSADTVFLGFHYLSTNNEIEIWIESSLDMGSTRNGTILIGAKFNDKQYYQSIHYTGTSGFHFGQIFYKEEKRLKFFYSYVLCENPEDPASMNDITLTIRYHGTSFYNPNFEG